MVNWIFDKSAKTTQQVKGFITNGTPGHPYALRVKLDPLQHIVHKK